MKPLQSYVGQQMKQFLLRNGINAKPTRTDQSSFIVPGSDWSTELYDYTYSDPAASIHFPPVRKVWNNQYAGVIYSISVYTSERKGKLPDIYRELVDLHARFVGAGWSDTDPMPSEDDLRQAVPRSGGTTTGFGVLKMMHGTTQATMILSTPGAVIEANKVGSAPSSRKLISETMS